MIYFRLNDAGAIDATAAKHSEVMTLCQGPGSQCARQPGRPGLGTGWFNRTDLDSYAQTCELAANATRNLGQGLFIGTDSGPHVSPRFDIIKAPAVGDAVSKAFNGDAYLIGNITRISPGNGPGGPALRVITVEGPRGLFRFYRRGLSGAWVQSGGTWSLIPGTVDERNPHF